jgi:hypothetical protein
MDAKVAINRIFPLISFSSGGRKTQFAIDKKLLFACRSAEFFASRVSRTQKGQMIGMNLKRHTREPSPDPIRRIQFT